MTSITITNSKGFSRDHWHNGIHQSGKLQKQLYSTEIQKKINYQPIYIFSEQMKIVLTILQHYVNPTSCDVICESYLNKDVFILYNNGSHIDITKLCIKRQFCGIWILHRMVSIFPYRHHHMIHYICTQSNKHGRNQTHSFSSVEIHSPTELLVNM